MKRTCLVTALVLTTASQAAAQLPADPHAGHVMPAASGAQLPVGSTAPPPPPEDRLADAVYGPDAMDRARGALRLEHGGAGTSQIMADRLEWQSGDGDGYHWDAEAWFGGDLNRLVLKTEGEGAGGEGLEAAEAHALWSRAVGPYANIQLGVRQDIEPASRTFLTIGFEALAPYWFELEGAAFLSDDGDVLARVEGGYDFRLSQRLIIQPQTELNFAMQDMPDLGLGSGLSTGEVGVRLRYEFRREFAPYVGVVYARRFGETADFAKAVGEDVSATRLVVGVRGWF